jgi:hypothetical protein
MQHVALMGKNGNAVFWWRNLQERENLNDLRVNGRLQVKFYAF